MLNKEPESFYRWVYDQLQRNPELSQASRDEIYQEIIDFIETSQKSQNVPYDSIIYSLGNKIQFLNSYLLKRGFAPLRSGRSPFKNFLMTMLALTAFVLIGGFSFYQYLKTQFDFDMDDGKITLFGQDLDVNQDTVKVAISGQYQDQYFSKIQQMDSEIKILNIDLGNTKSTFVFHSGEDFAIDCKIPIDQRFDLTHQGDTFYVAGPSESNCDFRIPQRLDFVLEFKNGRVSLDRPVSNLDIVGENGDLTWIKNPESKYQMVFEVSNQVNLGDFKDIFDERASNKANINLTNGVLSFVD